MLSLYRVLTDCAALPLRVLLRARAWRGKEEPLRLAERRGITACGRPDGALIWCHASSVGEATALLPLISHLLEDPEMTILLTTGTVSSARVMAERLPERAIHQFAPWDRRAWIARFLDHWQPDLAVRMESELWPNTLSALRAGAVPVLVINARLSEASVRGWQRFPAAAQEVMTCLDLVLAQSEEHAARFKTLGAPAVEVAGNLKLAAPPLPVEAIKRDALAAMIRTRPVWFAASTHPGEDEIAFEVHQKLALTRPDVLTIIAPRHPNRGLFISKTAADHGLTAKRRSLDETIEPSTAIYVADTLGELGTLFSIAPIVFMGKSLKVKGGQNPIEPCHFDCAILFGPYMQNFQDIAERMITEGSALRVEDSAALAESVARLMSNNKERLNLSNTAKKIVTTGDDSLRRSGKAILSLIKTTAKNSGHGSDGR
jgi:3-deoxy-D-manno-octulosonic-acid transferase